MPTPAQLGLLLIAILLFAAGGIVSICRLRWNKPSLRVAAKSCMYWGIVVSLAVLVWHSVSRDQWMPLEDNFDALIWLGVLLGGFVLYVQFRRPLNGLDWFVMPIVIILLVTAMVFGLTRHRDYDLGSVWEKVHWITAYGGTAAFAMAGAAGAMYLLSRRRLRTAAGSPAAPPATYFGSLERLEHLTFTSVTFGFALLTIGLITGLAIVLHHHGQTRLGPNWLASPKVVLAFSVWLVYALVLHAPINPVFRGRKAAMLSILGLVLTIGTLVAVQFMPQMAQTATLSGP